jgi:phage shock protein PspC (stress-responsive transcriptional regulator)
MTAFPSPEPPAAQPPAAEPPPLAAVPPRAHLYRSRTNRVLGGVCGGLAEYSGVEALIWRVGFIALALIGAGILVYPLLWILVPAGPDAPTTGLRSTLQNGRPPAA